MSDFPWENEPLPLPDGSTVVLALEMKRGAVRRVLGTTQPISGKCVAELLYVLSGRRRIRAVVQMRQDRNDPGCWSWVVRALDYVDAEAADRLLGPRDQVAACSVASPPALDTRDGPPKSDPAKIAAAPDSTAESRRRETKLPPSRVAARAVYDWALSAIAGADDMTVAQLWDSIQAHPDMTPAYLDKLPDTPATFARYLREAGVKRYDGAGKRTRRVSNFPRADQR